MSAYVEFIKFQRYILEETAGPKVMRPMDSGEAVAPAPCNLIAFLCKEMHQPLSEAMDCPVRTARWLHASWLDLQGKLQVWDDTREQLWEQAHQGNGKEAGDGHVV